MSFEIETVSGQHLRDVVGTFPSGVTVVTTVDNGKDIGLTVSSFASLSLEPALVMFSVGRSSSRIKHFREGSLIGISVLSDHQSEHAKQFARNLENHFDTVDSWQHSSPRLMTQAAAWFDGYVRDVYDGGDHLIFTVAVTACGTHDEARPLLYQRGTMTNWVAEYVI